MPLAISAGVVAMVTAEAGVPVVDMAVVIAIIKRVEVLDEKTRGPIGPLFYQETQLKRAYMFSSAGVRRPTLNNSWSR